MPRKKTTKREYTETFKMQAVDLVRLSNRSAASVAQQLNIQPWKLREWINQANELTERSAELDEVSRLRDENKRLKEDLEFLKKAAAYFAKNQQ